MSSGKTVVVSPSEVTLVTGGTQQFSAQLFQNGMQKKASFTWSSSNQSVATVSSAGVVTAVAGGEATVTATTGMTSGTGRVTVLPQLAAHLPLSGAGAFGSAVSAPGTGWVSQPGSGSVTRIDLASASFSGTTSAGPFPVQISANGDGSRIYVPTFFSNAMVLSINTATLSGVDTVFATDHGEDAYSVTNTPAGDTVFLGITNGPVFKIDMRGRTVLGRIDFPVAAGYHFEWNQTRTRLYASQRGFDGGRVFEIDPNSFTPLRTFETGGGAQGIQLSADGSKLFVAAQNGGIIVWDVASNSLVTTYPTPGCSPYGLVRTPNFLVVGCVFEGLVKVFNPSTGELLETLSLGGAPRELSYDPATRSIIVPNESGWVDILR
jgi:WD40 repeat protein